jgi:hypothetical protein
MYTLSNTEISVAVLDPISDVARLGSRYCTGGYIWQVSDSQKGELLSGPEYPKEPNTFDGQGMPDMFQHPLGADMAPVGGEVGCIGVGRVRRTSPEPFDVRINREVIEFVRWNVVPSGDTIQMQTEHDFKDWAYHLERTVSLRGRTVHSHTAIRNQGRAMLPVRWFAHPFFPITADQVLCRFSIPVAFPDNPGYFMNSQGLITRKADHDWKRGWYQVLEFDSAGSGPFSVVEKHPKVGQVTTVTDFMPGFLPIWGNANTFSFEPYFIRQLAAGESAAWTIEYTF